MYFQSASNLKGKHKKRNDIEVIEVIKFPFKAFSKKIPNKNIKRNEMIRTQNDHKCIHD